MPDTAFHDLILANLSTSSHVFSPYLQCSSHTAFFQRPKTLKAVFCLRASAHIALLVWFCSFTCFRYLIFSKCLYLATLSKGNFSQLVILYFIALCFHIFACLPKLLGKKLQRAEQKKMPKREATTTKTSKDKKDGGKSKKLKGNKHKIINLPGEKKFIKFLNKCKACMNH